ncbi:hypothetical protein WR25_08981 [Diploscapter pachys]|uniref:Uncharacterized protein n=1 Tax=Diploscapter pachys TaxID=2018661 RepID=A0A2A2M0Y9_9BILA|nr:hypothetical protein WR25_08981 [Diploscapter pachys]
MLLDVEFSQEFVCVAVVSSVCVILSFCCIFLWMCRCRRDMDKHSKKTNTAAKSEVKVSSSLKAGPKRPEGYGLPTEESQHKPTAAYEDETIEQFEKRMKRPTSRNSDRTHVKSRKSDAVSEMAISQDSLQRNDSKVNMFNLNNRMPTPATAPDGEMDLNPGLSGSINLETI